MAGTRQRRVPTLRSGDLLEVLLRDGRLAYIQYAFPLPPSIGGGVFRVLPGRYGTRPDDLAALVQYPEEYRVVWVGEALLEQDLATLVGTFPLPIGSAG